jgi:hypothetical protein
MSLRTSAKSRTESPPFSMLYEFAEY